MSNSNQQLADALRAAFAEQAETVTLAVDEVTLEVTPESLLEVATRLRDDENGYGPSGAGYIGHVDIPPPVEAAFQRLLREHDVRAR